MMCLCLCECVYSHNIALDLGLVRGPVLGQCHFSGCVHVDLIVFDCRDVLLQIKKSEMYL
jgi:hypothetical protein